LDIAAVLLVTSVMLVVAFLLLLLSLMRLRGTTRELQAALDDESGARDRAALLLAIASAVNSSLALEEVLNVALTHAGRLMGAVAGAIYLVPHGQAEMRREAEYNLTHRARGAVRKLDDEPLRTALAAMKPLVVKMDEKTAPGIEGGGHPQHALVVPVQRSGQLMGAMELYLNAWRELTEDQADLLNGVAAQAAIAIRHAQLFHAQEENALTDELTKLPNRRAFAQRFLQEMQRARRHRNAIAFLMIDLDHFKQVNDTWGHATGDHVLKAVADVLRNGIRGTDIVGRCGGEEFVALLPGLGYPAAVARAEQLRSAIADMTVTSHGKRRTPTVISGRTVSIGVAVLTAAALRTDRSDAELLDRVTSLADDAMYIAKATGRNRVCRADGVSVSSNPSATV
jgi:diguanylate cyclase (GGDEF)-like protein